MQVRCKILDALKRPGKPRANFSGDVTFAINYIDYLHNAGRSNTIESNDSSLLATGTTEDIMSVGVVIRRFYPYMYVQIVDWEDFPFDDEQDDICGKTKPFLEKRLVETTRLNGTHVMDVELVHKTPLVGIHFNKVPMLKITLVRPGHISVLRDLILKNFIFGPANIKLYECNVNFIQRFLVDKDIPGMGWVTVEADSYYVVDPDDYDRASDCHLNIVVNEEYIRWRPDIKFLPPVIKLGWDTEQLARGAFPNPRNLAHKTITHGMIVQIEDKNGIIILYQKLAISVRPCTVEGAKVIVVSNEYEASKMFQMAVNMIDPDFIIGYNSISHDMGFTVDHNRTLKLDDTHMVNNFCRQRNRRCHAMDIRLESGAVGMMPYRFTEMNRNQLDILIAVRRSLKLDSFKLDHVARSILGDYKDPVTPEMIPVLHDGTDEDRSMLTAYCIKDAQLPIDLDAAKLFSRLFRSISNFCRTPFMFILLRGTQVLLQAVLLQYLRKSPKDYVMNYVEIPDDDERDEDGKKKRKEKEYDGAVVLDPLRLGYYRIEEDGAIITLDFASHYPKIMIGYNLCYTTLVPPDEVDAMRARGIPVKQAPSPVADAEERRKRGEKVPEGHYFIYPWRVCTKDDAMRHMIRKHRVRCVMENSYLMEENRTRAQKNLPLDLPVLEPGMWQWEDPELVGILPTLVADLLTQRSNEKKELGRVQDKMTNLTRAMGLRGFFDGNVQAIELFLGQKKAAQIASSKPLPGETEVQKTTRMVAHVFVGEKKAEEHVAAGKDLRDILVDEMQNAVGELWEEAKEMYDGNKLSEVRSVLDMLSALESAHDGAQNALKILCNSMYGFTGASKGKLPCIPISSTVTAYGRDMILYSKRIAETRAEDGTYSCIGMPYEAEVIYGDTDSVMYIAYNLHDPYEAIEWGRKAAKYTSVRFQHPDIKLAFEKIYTAAIFFQKKKYIAEMAAEDQNGNIKNSTLLKGIETKRKDNPPGIRKHLVAGSDRLLTNEIDQSIMINLRLIQSIMMDEFPLDMYIESKSCGKTVDDYRVANTFAKMVERAEQRDPGSVDRSGRLDFVHIVNLDKKMNTKFVRDLSMSLETPDEVRKHPDRYTLDRKYYIENLRKVLGRIYADIITSNNNKKTKYPTYAEAKKHYKKRSLRAAELIFDSSGATSRYRDKNVFDKFHTRPVEAYPAFYNEFRATNYQKFLVSGMMQRHAASEFAELSPAAIPEQVVTGWTAEIDAEFEVVIRDAYLDTFVAFDVVDIDAFAQNASPEFKNTIEWYVWSAFKEKHGFWPAEMLRFGIPFHYCSSKSKNYERFVAVAKTGDWVTAAEGLKPESYVRRLLKASAEWREDFLNSSRDGKEPMWPKKVDLMRHPSDAMRQTPEFSTLANTHKNQIGDKTIFGPIAPAYITCPLSPLDREHIARVETMS